MPRVVVRALAALLVALVVAPTRVRAYEEIDNEADLERYLADEGDHELVVVCAVPPTNKWDTEREMVAIAEEFFKER